MRTYSNISNSRSGGKPVSDETSESLTEKANAAFRQAASDVIERARQTGTPVILWENGKVVERTWEELASQRPEAPNLRKQTKAEGESE